jgi:hypothetical protein
MQKYIFFRFNFDRSADKLRMPRDVFEFYYFLGFLLTAFFDEVVD